MKWYNLIKFNSKKQKKLFSKKKIEINLEDDCLRESSGTPHTNTTTMKTIMGSSSFDNPMDAFAEEAIGSERLPNRKDSKKAKKKKNVSLNNLYIQEFYKIQMESQNTWNKSTTKEKN